MKSTLTLIGCALILIASDGMACGSNGPPPKPKAMSAEAQVLFDKANDLIQKGKVKQSVRMYKRAVDKGSGQAAMALGDIYVEGKGDVPKNYGESLRWYQRAEKLGVHIPRAC